MANIHLGIIFLHLLNPDWSTQVWFSLGVQGAYSWIKIGIKVKRHHCVIAPRRLDQNLPVVVLILHENVAVGWISQLFTSFMLFWIQLPKDLHTNHVLSLVPGFGKAETSYEAPQFRSSTNRFPLIWFFLESFLYCCVGLQQDLIRTPCRTVRIK